MSIAATPKEPDLTRHQRWVAARRLASDDPLVVAASAAKVKTHSLRLILDEDPDFDGLVDAFRALKALPPEARRARLEDLCWDGAERAVLDGKVSTLNHCMRSLGVLGGPAKAAGGEATPSPPPPPSREGGGARGEPRAAELAPSPVRRMGEGRGEGGSAVPATSAAPPSPRLPAGTALSGPAFDPALHAPANLRGPCPPPPPEPCPSWAPGPTPAETPNTPRPNTNGPTLPTPIRPAREPVPGWRRGPPPGRAPPGGRW